MGYRVYSCQTLVALVITFLGLWFTLRRQRSTVWTQNSGLILHGSLVHKTENGFDFNMAPNLDVLKQWEDDYFSKVIKYTDIVSVLILKYDPNEGTSNTLINKYFNWTGDQLLCRNLENPPKKNALYLYNNTCSANLNQTFPYYSKLETMYHMDPEYPKLKRYRTIATFLTVIKNGLINGDAGFIISGSLKIIPTECLKHDYLSHLPPEVSDTSVTFEDQVFVISQTWGHNYFHSLVEEFPRMGPYIPFLQQNTHIKIHIYDNNIVRAMLTLLSISPSRIVTGHIWAKTVYLPEGTPCGRAKPFQTQLLAKYVQEGIDEKHPQGERKSVIVIRRSRLRRFTKIFEIERVVEKAVKDLGFKYELFSDNPVPSFETMVAMFNRAVMVIGPHGAGLSNVLFAKPGTFVIEGVCNWIHTNLCYQNMAHILGHRYHGIAGIKGCEEVNDARPDLIERAVRHFLMYISHNYSHYHDSITPSKGRNLQWEVDQIGDISFKDLINSTEEWFRHLQPVKRLY